MIGWEASRANGKPALIIQAIMLALAIAFYTNSSVADALRTLAEFKRAHGLFFVIVASVAAGALLPEFFLVLFFQGGRPRLANLRNVAFTIPVWGFDGSLVDKTQKLPSVITDGFFIRVDISEEVALVCSPRILDS